MSDPENPYRSPGHYDLPAGSQPPRGAGSRRSHATVVRLVKSGWLYRKLELSGELSATVEYNGRGLGYETVLVDGRVVARSWFYQFTWQGIWRAVAPQIDFFLPVEASDLPARFEIRSNPWTISALRLIVDGEVVYSEGRWPTGSQ